MRAAVESPRSTYPVVVEPGACADLGPLVASRRVVVVHPGRAAPFVRAHVQAHVAHAASVASVVVPDGEAAKTLAVAETIWAACAAQGLGPHDLVVAVGGGTCTDVAGFAAAAWRRGTRWVAVATTVVAMVDAAIGGKTAVNTVVGKNTAGFAWDPLAVLADLDALDGLRAHVVVDGLAEVVKVALSHDLAILDDLEAWTGDRRALHATLERAAAAAVDVASGRPGPGNSDDVLSLGHEIAHAVEAASGYAVGHGAAVALGLRYAVLVAGARAVCDDARLVAVLRHVGLPATTDAVPGAPAWCDVRPALRHDKRMGGRLRFLVPTPGGTAWSEDLDEAAAARIWTRCGGR